MRNLFAFILLTLLVACTQEIRPLKPFRPIPATPQSVVINDEAIEVGFSQIANAPDAYLNQLVRVQGAYVPLTVVKCPNQKGPILHWAIVAEELQMNAYGFERIVPLVLEGQQMIVEGVWRRHAGPAGCGKEPTTELIYYLDIKQIKQPNPIMRAVPVVADSAETDALISQPVQNGDSGVPPAGGSSEVSTDAPVIATPEPSNSVTQPSYPVPTLDNSAGILIPSPTRDLSPPTPTPSITPTPRQATNGTQPTSAPQATATEEPTAESPTEEPPTPAPTRTSPPTSVPRATVTPLPGTTSMPPTAEATADESATATLTPTATATQLPDGASTPTSEATADAEATETLTPTPTPTSTPDPEATETPTPTPSPSPAATIDAATSVPSTPSTPTATETPDGGYPAAGTPLPTSTTGSYP